MIIGWKEGKWSLATIDYLPHWTSIQSPAEMTVDCVITVAVPLIQNIILSAFWICAEIWPFCSTFLERFVRNMISHIYFPLLDSLRPFEMHCNAYGLKGQLIRYLLWLKSYTFCLFLWVPSSGAIVLLSCEENFVSITSAFVCSVPLGDDGIKPSTFSLPDLPFTSQCPQSRTAICSKWHGIEEGQGSVLRQWYYNILNWIRANIWVDFKKQLLGIQSKACCLLCLFPVCSFCSLLSARIIAQVSHRETFNFIGLFPEHPKASFFAFYFIKVMHPCYFRVWKVQRIWQF